MTLDRRSFHRRLGAGLALGLTGAGALMPTAGRARGQEGGLRSGRLFTSTNGAAGNELIVVGADGGGALALQLRVATGGLGSGAGLGSQGAVTLSDDGRYLFVVNAGGNTVSTFAIDAGAFALASVHDSGGLHPISVTERAGLVYVLNDGGAGNVAGFRNVGGTLQPIAGSVRPLSAAGGTGPAQVSLGPDADVLVVTEKATSRLVSYAIDAQGRAGAPKITASAGVTPFGFAFDRRNRLLVSEAGANTLSSYRYGADGSTPIVVSAAVPNGQAATCWALPTPNGRFVYTGNAGTGTVSHYAVAHDGSVTLVNGAAGFTGPGGTGGAGDLAIPLHGRTLSILGPRAPGIFSFTVGGDGALTPEGSITGLPAGVVGLAAN